VNSSSWLGSKHLNPQESRNAHMNEKAYAILPIELIIQQTSEDRFWKASTHLAVETATEVTDCAPGDR